MAVIHIATPGISIATPFAPKVSARGSLAPRVVPEDTPVFTRRELAIRERLNRTYREMYTTGLPELDAGAPLVVGVTSAARGEGRTTTALGLALAVARDLDVHVLLIELDLERPTLARDLKLAESPGLVEVLTKAVDLGVALRHLDTCGVDILPAGQTPRVVSRLLRSAALRDLLAIARSSYEVVILDLPPALASSDVVPLSGLTDGLLMVVRAGVTPARLITQATERFPEGKVRGVVLTGQHSKIPNWLRRLF